MIQRDAFYDHDTHGRVAVTSIRVLCASYDPETGERDESGVYVDFCTEWDAYGPMTPYTSESISEFADEATFVREIEDWESESSRSKHQ